MGNADRTNAGVSRDEALRAFAAAVTAKMTSPTPGEAEEQLRGPFENFMAARAATRDWYRFSYLSTPLPFVLTPSASSGQAVARAPHEPDA